MIPHATFMSNVYIFYEIYEYTSNTLAFPRLTPDIPEYWHGTPIISTYFVYCFNFLRIFPNILPYYPLSNNVLLFFIRYYNNDSLLKAPPFASFPKNNIQKLSYIVFRLFDFQFVKMFSITWENICQWKKLNRPIRCKNIRVLMDILLRK